MRKLACNFGLLAAAALCIESAGCSRHPAVKPIVYQSDGLKITGYLCRPKGAGPFPLILVNHGGFDQAKKVRHLIEIFAEHGYVAIASSYRGIGGSEGKNEDTKGEIDDVLNAITYAKTLPFVDTSRTVMLGHSHGGSIALHAAARDPAIKAIVTYAAPTELADLYRYWEREGKTDPRFEDLTTGSSIIGGTPDEVPAAWKERSALYLASKIKCPVMLIQGGRDRIVPSEQANRMAEALRAAGNTQVELVVDPEGGHPFDKATFAHIEKRVFGFLNARVGLPAPK